jgi:hypothetical protein
MLFFLNVTGGSKMQKVRVAIPTLQDFLLTPILRITIEPLSKKISHFWNWRPYNGNLRAVYVPGNRIAKDRSTLWRRFWQSNFAWKTVIILEPENYTGEWHLGYSARGEGWAKKEWCTVILCGKVAALVGPEDVSFFGIDNRKNPIQIRVVEWTIKEQLPDSIPLV